MKTSRKNMRIANNTEDIVLLIKISWYHKSHCNTDSRLDGMTTGINSTEMSPYKFEYFEIIANDFVKIQGEG